MCGRSLPAGTVLIATVPENPVLLAAQPDHLVIVTEPLMLDLFSQNCRTDRAGGLAVERGLVRTRDDIGGAQEPVLRRQDQPVAAHPLGITSTVLDPGADPCAAVVAGHVRGEFDDHQALYELVKRADVVTYEFENVPATSVEQLIALGAEVAPGPRALAIAQDRFSEKTFLNGAGAPTVAFAAVVERWRARGQVASSAPAGLLAGIVPA